MSSEDISLRVGDLEHQAKMLFHITNNLTSFIDRRAGYFDRRLRVLTYAMVIIGCATTSRMCYTCYKSSEKMRADLKQRLSLLINRFKFR